MQNAQYPRLKKEGHSTNRFNDCEYERWSKGIKTTQSPTTQLGIERFLGTTENLQAGREDTSVFLIEIGKSMKKSSPILFGNPACSFMRSSVLGLYNF